VGLRCGSKASPGSSGSTPPRRASRCFFARWRRSGPPARGLSWRGFLKAQAAASSRATSSRLRRAFLQTLYVLFFIEIGTRRVHVTVSTTNPDSSFVTQQARNLVMSLADEGAQIRFLIRDRDAKFPRSFD